MRKIDKGPEPQEWKAYRETPGVRYQPIPSLVDALLEEQGFICAYCERSIPHQDAPGEEDHRIDHLSTQKKARQEGDDSDLDYGNMVICCPGNIANNRAFYHCDKYKGHKDLTISPLSAAMMSTIRFTPTGRIKSIDSQLDGELNEGGLNLNNDFLVQHRQEAWATVAGKLTEIGWTKKHVTAMLAKWENRHTIKYKDHDHFAYYPFCSMICFMLRKKLANGTLK